MHDSESRLYNLNSTLKEKKKSYSVNIRTMTFYRQFFKNIRFFSHLTNNSIYYIMMYFPELKNPFFFLFCKSPGLKKSINTKLKNALLMKTLLWFYRDPDSHLWKIPSTEKNYPEKYHWVGKVVHFSALHQSIRYVRKFVTVRIFTYGSSGKSCPIRLISNFNKNESPSGKT